MYLQPDKLGRLHDERGRFAKNPNSGAFQSNGDPRSPRARDAKVVIPGRLYEGIGELMRGYIHLINDILVNSDIAYRRDRNLQRQMRRDPDIMGPLLQRQYAVALLDWDIVPEDQDDKKQVKEAESIKKNLERYFRNWHDFLRQEQEAIWWGMSASNVIYERTPDGMIGPIEWRPFHSDSLLFTSTGQLGMRVGYKYKGSMFPTWDGLAHLFDETERQAVVLHVWMSQAGDYEEWEEARYTFSGRGLRDVLYFQWLMKQVAVQLWMTFLQRYAMGIRVGTYPDGNTEARDEMAKALRNIVGDVSVLIPATASKDTAEQYSITIHDPPGSGKANMYMELIMGYLAGRLKELIIGQSATTEATSSGLGGGVAQRHAETKLDIIKYDAYALADTLSHELVGPMSRINFGDMPYRPKLRFNIEEVDSEKFIDGAMKYVDHGGVVSDRQIRGRMGLEKPVNDEDKLGGMDDFDGIGGGGGTDLAGIRRALTSNGNANRTPQETSA